MRQPANADALQAASATEMPAARFRDALLTTLIVVAALLLRWPGLQAGLHSDDYVQEAMLSGRFPAHRSALTLYDFGGRDAGERALLRAQGWFPWWSAAELRLAMWRPLSSALVAADHALWPRSAGLRHAHSAMWCAALLLGVAAVLRRVLPAATALLAFGLFAAEPALSVPLAWLANRNALVATALGVWGLYAYLRFRAEARGGWAAAAALGFALAALAGEYAVPLVAYVVVYEAFVARGPAAERARCAALVLTPVALVAGAGVALGYGTRASGLYVSPLLEPARYLSASLTRVPALAAELLCALPAPSSRATGAESGWFAPLAAAIALIVLIACLRHTPQHVRGSLRWLGASSLLGLPLLAGALPEPRLLLPAAVGSAGVIAAVLVASLRRARGLDGADSARARALAAVVALAICALHLGVKPVRALQAAELLAARSRGHTAWALRAEAGGAGARGQEWVVIAARDFTTAQILPYVRAFHGLALPRAYRVLSLAPAAHELHRLDARTLELIVLGAPPRDAFAGSLHRPLAPAFLPGTTAAAGDLRVRVEQVEGGQPMRTRFVFARPLDDPGYVFLHPGAAGLSPIALPAIGERLQLPPPRAPRLPR